MKNIKNEITKRDLKKALVADASHAIFTMMGAIAEMNTATIEEDTKKTAAVEALKALFLEVSARG